MNRGRAQGAVSYVRPVRTRFHKADILPSSVTFAKALRSADAYEFLWQFAQVPVFSRLIFSFFTYALKACLFPVEKIFWRAASAGWQARRFGGILERNFRTHRVSPIYLQAEGDGDRGKYQAGRSPRRPAERESKPAT